MVATGALRQTYAGMGRMDGARVSMEPLLHLLPTYLLQNPDDSRARMFHAVTLAELGRKEEAIREGTQALEFVLSQLPRTCPGIVVVQHMPERFTAAFAERLNSICEIEVREAPHGTPVLPGAPLIAPGGRPRG